MVQTILSYLEMVANNNLFLNLSMHIVVLMALIAAFFGTKEKIRRFIFHVSLSTLFLSVTATALVFGNPFHAITFGLLALTALIQLFVSKQSIEISKSKWSVIIALLFIFIGLWYPEFVKQNALVLLMVSPVGAVPCPTLLTALGLLILISPSVNRAQYLVTIMMGLVYGIIGVAVLKVYLDITLLVLALYAVYIYLKNFTRYAPSNNVLVNR